MAAMKTSVGRLYMLFNACLPENENVIKRLNICKITESVEYNGLKSYEPFKENFEKYFSADSLAKYDAKKLDEIIKVIPKIIPLIDKISNSITYGNAAELTEKDLPDFTSLKSIDELDAKLKIEQANPNITNITKDNFMEIFSDKTIKDPEIALKSISANDMNNPEEAVKRILSRNIYCIKAKDITDIKEKFAGQIVEINNKLEKLNREKWKLRYKKWMYIGVAIILLTAIDSFELLSVNTSSGLTLFSALLLIVYFFIG